MFSNQLKVMLYLLVVCAIRDLKAWTPFKNQKQFKTAEKILPTFENAVGKEAAYNDKQVQKVEKVLVELQDNKDKIETLLKLSDWYEASFNNPETLEKAFDYANDALRLSQSLHSDMYAGKCYLQFSMLYQLRNNNPMIEVCARKAHLKESAIYPIIMYQAKKRNSDIVKLKNKTLLQQSKLENEVFLRNSMVTFVVLVLIILALLYKSFIFKKKTNKILEMQQNEINKKNNTLQNLVVEKEWLLREIHHRVKNNLHMVVGLLASQVEFLKK